QEEDDDRPRVDDDLEDGHHVGLEAEEEERQEEERRDQPEGAVDGIAVDDDYQGRRHGERREDQEERDAHVRPSRSRTRAADTTTFSRDSGSSPFHPRRMSWS